MINTRRKIIKDKGGVPTPLEEEVAKALVEIEVSPSCDYKAEMREVYISGATEIEVGKGGEAMILHIPFRAGAYPLASAPTAGASSQAAASPCRP